MLVELGPVEQRHRAVLERGFRSWWRHECLDVAVDLGGCPLCVRAACVHGRRDAGRKVLCLVTSP